MIVLEPKLTARALTPEQVDKIVGSVGELVPRTWDYDYHYWRMDYVSVQLFEDNDIGIDDRLGFGLDEMPDSLEDFRDETLYILRTYRATRRLVREFALHGYTQVD